MFIGNTLQTSVQFVSNDNNKHRSCLRKTAFLHVVCCVFKIYFQMEPLYLKACRMCMCYRHLKPLDSEMVRKIGSCFGIMVNKLCEDRVYLYIAGNEIVRIFRSTLRIERYPSVSVENVQKKLSRPRNIAISICQCRRSCL